MVNLIADEKLYQIAGNQAGYFATTQAEQTGVSRRQLSYYAKTGRYVRIKPGVYRLALYPASEHEDLFIAWLAAGKDAVVSHDSALAVYELSDALPREIHLIVPRTASRRHMGMRMHTNQLSTEEVTSYSGLPVTTVPRTIADVATGGLAEEMVIQAVLQAIQRGLASKEELTSAAQRYGGKAAKLILRALGETNR